MYSIARFFQKLLDLVLPLSPESLIARSISEEVLADLLNPVTVRGESWITALFPYQNPKIRALVRAVKYRGEKMPLSALGRVAADEVLEIIAEKKTLSGWSEIMLVPIPTSSERLRSRGYNQTERIAWVILPHLGSGIEYDPDVLTRTERKSQGEVTPHDRKKNVQDAFSVLRADKVTGRKIILIDDVVESGATLHDARRALLRAGATDVIAIAIAH